MQLAKMKVGTTYLVNTWNRWKDYHQRSDAYVLVSKEPRMSKRVRFASDSLDTLTLDGITYAHATTPWTPGYKDKTYLMLRVDSRTGEALHRDSRGYPVLSLIRTRDVRGPWDEAKAEAMEYLAARALLRRFNRLMETRPSYVKSSVGWQEVGHHVVFSQGSAEAVVLYLEELLTENNRLKDEAARRSWNLEG